LAQRYVNPVGYSLDYRSYVEWQQPGCPDGDATAAGFVTRELGFVEQQY
jgi:hypothetical protein